jgi:hypothetical protein
VSLNALDLLGLVVIRPRTVGDSTIGFLVLTQRDRRAERIDRHRDIVVPGAVYGD